MSVWEDQSCPKCGVSKSDVPMLKLLYSSCCGSVLCQNCVTEIFRRSKGAQYSYSCPDCNSYLNAKDFDKKTFGQQLMDSGKRSRERFQDLFSLKREQFEDDDSWNDHLEFLEDLIYRASISGEDDGKKGIEREVQEYRAKFRDKYQIAAGQFQVNRPSIPAGDEILFTAPFVQQTMNNNNNNQQQNAPAPLAFPKPIEKSKKTPDISLLSPTSQKKELLRLKMKPILCKRASGFSDKVDQDRTVHDMFDSLFIFN